MILGNFRHSIVNIWNSLSNAVVDIDSVDLFKSRLDIFWMSQDVKYDYTVNHAGIGDRSEYDTESRAVLSNGPAGPGPRAPKPQGSPNSPCVIFHLVK